MINNSFIIKYNYINVIIAIMKLSIVTVIKIKGVMFVMCIQYHNCIIHIYVYTHVCAVHTIVNTTLPMGATVPKSAQLYSEGRYYIHIALEIIYIYIYIYIQYSYTMSICTVYSVYNVHVI